MKKLLSIAIITLGILAFITFIIYKDAVKIIKHPFIEKAGNVEVKVVSGDSLNSVIEHLYSEKKIGNSYLIKWYIKSKNLSSNIKPGSFKFPADISIEDFVRGLSDSKFNENSIKVTIPEGYDIDHIATLLQSKGLISKEDFLNSCKDYTIPSYIKNEAKRKYALEGYLFPDTYEIIKGTTGKQIIDMMLKDFNLSIKQVEAENNTQISASDLDKVITMASIVEREAELPNERPIVASVFYNRVKIHMKLQSCATLEYALGVHKTIYSDKETTTPSPYNTYYVTGMPIGPICNPGKASIIAALEPANTKHLFFVSKFDGSKSHFFSETDAQFFKDKKTSEANYAKLGKWWYKTTYNNLYF